MSDITHTEIATGSEKGKWYWFLRNATKQMRQLGWKYRILLSLLAVVFFLLIFAFRPLYHSFILGIRIHLFYAIATLCVLVSLYLLVKKRWWKTFFTALTGLIIFFVIVFLCDVSPHKYLTLYRQYKMLNIVELDDLPQTAYERIQPYNSIHTLANEAMMETETPTEPDFVRIGEDYRWTMAIEPAYNIPRIWNNIKSLVSVSASAPSPDFSSKNRISVDFGVGENLLLSKNTHTATIRAFGLRRYLSYEPSDVKYVTNDSGEWVQIVSLVRWRGILFPRPEFGGVQVIRQDAQHSLWSMFKRWLLGTGKWISPEEISKHTYLVNQSTLPKIVSRFIANSFRFQEGFFAPLPAYHRGDIRIPDLPEDIHDQPFTVYANFENDKAPDGLYQYFALEPFHPDKQGLSTSLFIPADGKNVIYVYKHHLKSEALTGVSAIAAKVIESKKFYDWNRNHPVEHRPFIRLIDGKMRFLWLTTVVTKKELGGKQFIAGSIPDVVLTDAAYKVTSWVDPLHPELWIQTISKEFAGVWNQK